MRQIHQKFKPEKKTLNFSGKIPKINKFTIKKNLKILKTESKNLVFSGKSQKNKQIERLSHKSRD